MLKFVNLHGHSVAGSPFDALGYPDEHIDFAIKNGMDALALTEHGNMNGLSYQVLHSKKLNKKGVNFKPIFGVEAYYIDSVEEWREEYQKASEDKEQKKEIEEKSDGIVFEEEERGIIHKIKGNSHFLLLAQNLEGLQNLYRIVSISSSPEYSYFKPRIDFELLEKYSKGLVASTTCISGVFAKLIWQNPGLPKEDLKVLMRPYFEKFIYLFGKERFYGEIQANNIPEQHILNISILELCKEYGLKSIATVDSHYPNPESWLPREIYKRLAWLGRSYKPHWITDDIPKSVDEIGYELYPKNGDQMFYDFQKYAKICNVEYDWNIVKESIENSYYVAHEVIEKFYPDTKYKFPSFVIQKNEDPDEVLKVLCLKSLKKLPKMSTFTELKRLEYYKRLEMELEVVKNRGFAKYFLTVDKIVSRAKEMMLIGPARGSAGASIIAYLLGITQVDPIEWNLSFSRFLRSDSDQVPDIDIDFSRNDEMKEEISNLFGSSNVCNISNFNTLQLRSLIKDISKLLQIEFEEVNEVTKVMESEAIPKAKEIHGIKAGVYKPTWEEVLEYSETLQNFLKKYPEVEQQIQVLIGQVRSNGTHAAGVLICDNIWENMPLIKVKGKTQTPWAEGQNVRHLEPMGFVKYDILGLDTLRMFETCIDLILKRHYNISNPEFSDIVRFYNENLHPDVIDFNDQKVYHKVFRKNLFPGIFQFGKEGIQKFGNDVNPEKLMDVASVSAIYRPGGISAEADKMFVVAKKNPNSVKYPHKLYKEVTEDTYGILVFQEQISELCTKLSDLISEEDGHEIRKLLTKKEKGGNKGKFEKFEDEFIQKMVARDFSPENAQKLKVYYEKFKKGCKNLNIPEFEIEKIWTTIEYNSGYSFNKSHAVAYSMITFQCAWLFTYFEVEWLCAYLNHEKEENKEEAISIVEKMGYDVTSLNINESEKNWKISGNNLIPPLTTIKGLGEMAVDEILTFRPFQKLEDLLYNPDISYRKLTKRSFDALSRCGALNCLKDERFENSKHLWKVVTNKPKKFKEFDEFIKSQVCEDFTQIEKIENIISLTGKYPYEMVIAKKKIQKLEEIGVRPISKFEEGIPCWFIVKEVVEKLTKSSKIYWILKCVDSYGGSEDVKCWGVNPERDSIKLNQPIMATVDYDKRYGFSMRNLRKSIEYL